MNKVRAVSYALAAAVVLAVGAGSAQAQETAPSAAPARGGLGVGAAAMLRGPSGLNVVFDAGRWHADAILGIAGDAGGGPGGGGTTIDLGARGWFHLHQGSNSDFSLGGGLGFQLSDPDGPADSTNVITIDIGAQIRAFVTSNVALSAFGGLAVITGDADGFALDGQPVGILGLTYFFW